MCLNFLFYFSQYFYITRNFSPDHNFFKVPVYTRSLLAL